jgi:hypothetical protein
MSRNDVAAALTGIFFSLMTIAVVLRLYGRTIHRWLAGLDDFFIALAYVRVSSRRERFVDELDFCNWACFLYPRQLYSPWRELTYMEHI